MAASIYITSAIVNNNRGISTIVCRIPTESEFNFYAESLSKKTNDISLEKKGGSKHDNEILKSYFNDFNDKLNIYDNSNVSEKNKVLINFAKAVSTLQTSVRYDKSLSFISFETLDRVGLDELDFFLISTTLKNNEIDSYTIIKYDLMSIIGAFGLDITKKCFNHFIPKSDNILTRQINVLSSSDISEIDTDDDSDGYDTGNDGNDTDDDESTNVITPLQAYTNHVKIKNTSSNVYDSSKPISETHEGTENIIKSTDASKLLNHFKGSKRRLAEFKSYNNNDINENRGGKAFIGKKSRTGKNSVPIQKIKDTYIPVLKNKNKKNDIIHNDNMNKCPAF